MSAGVGSTCPKSSVMGCGVCIALTVCRGWLLCEGALRANIAELGTEESWRLLYMLYGLRALMLTGLLPMTLLTLELLAPRLLYGALPAVWGSPNSFGARMTVWSAHSLTHAEPRSAGDMYDAEA